MLSIVWWICCRQLYNYLTWECKDELNAKEPYNIRTLQRVNKCVPGRAKEQYKQDHKKQIRVKDLEFYHKNNERINKKKSMKVNCDCGSIESVRHKAQHLKSKKNQEYVNSLNSPTVIIIRG